MAKENQTNANQRIQTSEVTFTFKGNSDNVRSVPRSEGDKVTLILTKKFTVPRTATLANGTDIEWDEIPTVDGMGVPVKQVLRRNNGLDLSGTTMKECAEALCDYFDEQNHLTLEIDHIKLRNYENGTAQFIVWKRI